MPTRKKLKTATIFKPAKGHKIPLQAGSLDAGVLDVFGKLVDPSPVDGLAAGHQLALVYGIREGGTCTKLRSPQHVALPAPDGPADGCGWDPSNFLVWKNLAKTLITTHVQMRSLSLQDALRPAATAALVSEPTVDDVLHQWLSQSIPGQMIPDQDQLQVAWRNFGSGGAFTAQVQQNLANLLNSAFSLDIQASRLSATMTVADLKSDLNRST
jgi:hypothetical protein